MSEVCLYKSNIDNRILETVLLGILQVYKNCNDFFYISKAIKNQKKRALMQVKVRGTLTSDLFSL